MDFEDDEELALRFRSKEEAEAFHLELTDLVREVMIATSREIPDGEEAAAETREVLKRYKTIARALNTMRRVLPKHGG